ncbi:MAG: hypothetical protein V7720_03155 [Halioglobus sp.]
MAPLRDFLSPRTRLLRQARQINKLEQEVKKLKAQNESMREGMRRCVTCEYRLDFKDRQNAAPIEILSDN